jgi:hypothetical protein
VYTSGSYRRCDPADAFPVVDFSSEGEYFALPLETLLRREEVVKAFRKAAIIVACYCISLATDLHKTKSMGPHLDSRALPPSSRTSVRTVHSKKIVEDVLIHIVRVIAKTISDRLSKTTSAKDERKKRRCYQIRLIPRHALFTPPCSCFDMDSRELQARAPVKSCLTIYKHVFYSSWHEMG